MNTQMKLFWLLPLVALAVSAGELPFTASLMPYTSPDTQESMVQFFVKNETEEPITSIVITRGDKTFKYVTPRVANFNGDVITPERVDDARGRVSGYIYEFWQCDTSSYNIQTHLDSFHGDNHKEYFQNASREKTGTPDRRSIQKGGNFGDFEKVGNYFVAHSHGFYQFVHAGNYYFQLDVDDGAIVTMWRANGEEILLFNKNDNKKYETGVSYWMNAGEVVYISAVHSEKGGDDYFKLKWSRDSKKTWNFLAGNQFRINPPTATFAGPQYVKTDPIGSGGSSGSKVIRITNCNVARGEEIIFAAALSEAISEGYAPTLLWNLDSTVPKTTIQAFGLWGNTSTITLGSSGSTEIAPNSIVDFGIKPPLDSPYLYMFLTQERPVTLKVRHISEDGKSLPKGARFNVTLTDPSRTDKELGQIPPQPLGFTNLTATVPSEAEANWLFLRAGTIVDFEAVAESYFGSGGNFLYDSNNPDAANNPQDAVERFVATGLNINDTLQTGDPTRHRFEIRNNTVLEFRTRHEYALDVKSDFRLTESDMKASANTNTPWAGPLTSAASGNPEPSAGTSESVRHWFNAGEQFVAQIDAEVQDLGHNAEMLYTRYIPYEYIATGAARGDEAVGVNNLDQIYTNAFKESRLVGNRHQINFKMDMPGSIQYNWKIQFGVYAQSPEPSLRKVQKFNVSSGAWEDVDPVGSVYWFDQRTAIRVLSAANKDGVDSNALTGWVLGDGYYFQNECSIDTSTGQPINFNITRNALNNPVARWVAKQNIEGKEYHGLEIPDSLFLRPVAVTWSYGKHVFYDSNLKLGEYMLQGRSTPIEKTHPTVAARIFEEPSAIDPPDAAIWDPNAKVLFPVKPGLVKAIYNGDTAATGFEVHINARWPDKPHYTHIADTPPVQLTPDSSGSFLFVEKAFAQPEVAVVIQNNSEFTASGSGWSVLRFKEIKRVGRAEPKEYIALRTVQTNPLKASLNANKKGNVIIGQAIRDVLDLAEIGTGYLVYQDGVRYNPNIYNRDKLSALNSVSLYDMAQLKALYPKKVILNPGLLPGPIIPVNQYPSPLNDPLYITVVWYDNPIVRDGLLWPYAARNYDLQWPTTPAEGLGRIVIASEWGSESRGADGLDQVIVPADGNIPAETTFNPTRFSDLKVYAQGNEALAGYNPNEEHALIAPSLRYAQVSPRPNAVYALRAGDLNNYGKKTSDAYVLVQFFDNVLQEYGMRVFSIEKEDMRWPGHSFAKQSLLLPNAGTPQQLIDQPHKTMEAGEPVMPFYPLGVVEGAVPCPESTGENLLGQTTFWKDHKNTRWSVSGGPNAWFAVKAFYPLQPDFWWPSALKDATLMDGKVVEPQISASVAFLPPNLNTDKLKPTRILYFSEWPRIAPTLKAGETLTYSGGENRADNPTSIVPTKDKLGVETIQTPGLPAVVAFAVGEVIFDELNPDNNTAKLMTDWTVRIAQVMETRRVSLSAQQYPDVLQPANGKVRQYQGKYIFKDLPASLQKRVRYDPVTQELELRGVLNDKTIDDATLTASPAAVYALEPNILTDEDVMNLKALAEDADWVGAVDSLLTLSLNPNGLRGSAYEGNKYSVGLQPKITRDEFGIAVTYMTNGFLTVRNDVTVAENARAFGTGLAVIPNGNFLDPTSSYPDECWVTIAENNDPSMGGSPVALHVIKVDRNKRYRGSIKVVLSDNVFDENVVLRHTGDFGANGDDLVYEWWYRPDDGKLDVLPPFMEDTASAGDWKLFPDLSGAGGQGRNEILLKGDPNAPETLLADSWWFVRYRHINDAVNGSNWKVKQPDNSSEVNYTWAGAGNSDPFHDFDLDGYNDYKAQLVMGWIKRVLDAVNPYEARINDFTGDAPATGSSMLQQLGPAFEGAVALNPDKNVIENVGLIELYQTILSRAMDLSIDLSTPISTPAIANALQLAATRLSDFYMLLGNEAYVDANDPTIGYGSSSVEYGAFAPVVHAFQNQASDLLEEELMLLRGQDDGMARPVYNRLFWNFTKGEGEAAYAMNYNISDINKDGFIDEADAMILYPQGHGDAWGHYLTAVKQQYTLLTHDYFNWVSRSEFYNLMNVVMKVDFLDERKFAQVAAQKAKTGAEIVANNYREYFTEDETAQWQGYTDVNPDRAWGVQDWARRAGQGAYFDWIVANALLPSTHPNETLEGIQKVDRVENADIRLISANLNRVQNTMDSSDNGFNPIGISSKAVPFDINPQSWTDFIYGRTHFEQIYDRAIAALLNAQAAWDNANAAQNRLRAIANSEQEFRNDVYQQDISYRNALIEIFGRPYPGTVGSGKFYQDGYIGPDLAYYMYVAANSTAADYFPQPLATAVDFDGDGNLVGGTLFSALSNCNLFQNIGNNQYVYKLDLSNYIDQVSMLFGGIKGDSDAQHLALNKDGVYDMSSSDFTDGKNPLADLDFELAVTASTYSLLAPISWGDRPAVGELQQIIAEMLQQQIVISDAFGSYQDMFLDLIRAINLLEIQREIDDRIAKRNQDLYISKSVINTVLLAAKTLFELMEETGDQVELSVDGVSEALPKQTPIIGMANSIGDALAPARGALKVTGASVSAGLGLAGIAAKITEFTNEILWEITEGGVELVNADDERLKSYIEAIASIDDMLDEEGGHRANIFAKAEQLRSLVELYRSALSRGAMLMDEREAFNRRVAAMVQQNRYQDMTFRVQRNAALQNYHQLMDIAARYTYLAAKAYDYETNLMDDDPGSPSALFEQIAKERSLGYIADGNPQIGSGLAGVLAQLNANYGVLKHRFGLTNPQVETGKLSLRTEHFRIFPEEGDPANPADAGAAAAAVVAGDWMRANDATDNWKQALNNARVKDLWTVPEFRYLARPFNDSMQEEPGIAIRFSTEITSGKNVFGKPLAGGDHAYDPSVYATRIRSLGVWFSGYHAEDVLADLSATPRVYLIPTGADVMSVPNAISPNQTRVWNVLDQVIPTPIPSITSKLQYSNFVPLLDSLDGRIGQQRRFSSFRAYHDSGMESVDINELVRDSRLAGRSVWNTGWILIIPGRALNADPNEGLDRFIEQVSDIKLVFETYGFSGN